MNIEKNIQEAMRKYNINTITELKYTLCQEIQTLRIRAVNWDSFAASQLDTLTSFLKDIENFEHKKHNAKSEENNPQPIYAICCDYDEQTWVIKLTLSYEDAKEMIDKMIDNRNAEANSNYSYYIIEQLGEELKIIS